mgnify:CR=1 FL=1
MEIYTYIINTLKEFFQAKGLRAGDRFNIYFEKMERVTELFDAFDTSSFDYHDANYQIQYIIIHNIKLIIACNNEYIKEDFLTKLRNKVSQNEGIFSGTAILFIHNTQLDSLTGGTESLLKEGMPLHVKTIKADIENKINDDQTIDLQSYEKLILLDALAQQHINLFEDKSSLFDFEVFLEIIAQKKILPKQYKSLGIFNDRGLESLDKATDIKNRVEANRDLFDKVDRAHKYGTPKEDLKKHFVSTGVNRLSQVYEDIDTENDSLEEDEVLNPKSWYLEDFQKVKKWSDNKKFGQKPVLELVTIEKPFGSDSFWDKGDGATIAKQRQRNIVIFNHLIEEEGHTCKEIGLTFRFNINAQKNNIYHNNRNNLKVSHEVSGQFIKLNLIPEEVLKTSYCKIQYSYVDKDTNEPTRFEFRIFILPISECLIKDLKTDYLVKITNKEQYIEKRRDYVDQVLVFNDQAKSIKSEKLSEGVTYIIEEEERLELAPTQDYDEEFVGFNLQYEQAIIPLHTRVNYDELKIISGSDVWQQKQIKQESFRFYHENKGKKNEIIKLKQGNSEYAIREAFRDNLKLEAALIETGGVYWKETSKGVLEKQDIIIDTIVESHFNAIIQYYRTNNFLPSLTLVDTQARKLIQNFLVVFLDKIKNLQSGSPLSEEEKNLANIGVITESYGGQQIKYTPLHPINLAYQLTLNEKLKDWELRKEIFNKLTPLGIVPYCGNKEDLFAPVEQFHSLEWLYFQSLQIDTTRASKRYASQLVEDKIKEFISHFQYLFVSGSQAPLKINLINLGNCKEAFQGIFSYYKSVIKNAFPIDVYIYGSENYITKFEEFSFYSDVETIEEEFGINLKIKDHDPEDVLNVFRKKVHFYNKKLDDTELTYAHLSFYQFKPSEMTVSYNDSSTIPTGLSLEGLVNDIPSVFENKSYRTGFGAMGLSEKTPSLLTDLATYYNSLIKVAKSTDPFRPKQAICTVISDNSKDALDKIYKSSQWLTFIDPKVDLNYFKGTKDVVIIHYSDQYSNTSGYDAITVTRKVKQYQFVIEEHLKNKLNVNTKPEQMLDIINMFNALNGDWLLRLISHNENHFDREKISILSAVKVALSFLHHPNIIWIPISLEEILRISGGAGLSQKDGIFSAKNLGFTGKHSDDLLMIGLEEAGEKLLFHLYPIEVKVGKNPSNVIEKAIEQAKKTAEVLEKTLHQDGHGFKQKFYHNFFAKLVLISAEKMKIYAVWPEEEAKWNKVLTDYRYRLLNNGFSVSKNLRKFIGEFAVISFKKGIFMRKIEERDGGMIIELPEADGYHHLLKTTEELKHLYQGKTITEDLLSIKYSAKIDNNTLSKDTTAEDSISQTPITSSKQEKVELTSNNAQPVDNQPLSILFGHEVNYPKEVRWYPTSTDKVMHTNTGIIGTMGTGKTQFTMSLITQLVQNSRNNVKETKIGMLVFDYNEDYIEDEFTEAINAKVYRPERLIYNPLSLVSSGHISKLPLIVANKIKDTIATVYNLGHVQQQRLKDAIMQAYSDKGIDKNDASTWKNIPPSIADVCQIILNDPDTPKDSLYTAISDLYEFELFEPDASKTAPLFDIIDGVTVVDLQKAPKSTRDLIVAITLDLFYSEMQSKGHSIVNGNFREITNLIMVDEADNLLRKDFATLKDILKEGRKYGVGCVLSTQFLNHFSTSNNEYSRYIKTWIVHQVDEINVKEVDTLFNLETKNEKENLIKEIKNLKKHYSMVNLAGSKPIFMKDRAFWELVKQD